MDELLENLQQFKFDKQLKRLNKKLKDKKIVIYGTGLLFERIKDNYDLSNLNIIGISDRKYCADDEGSEAYGYKIIPLDKIADYNPDYILISTLRFLGIMDDFRNNVFKGTNIGILPLADKPFFTLLKGIFS